MLGQKKFWVNFLCLKKQVGLTQGGGYMTPSPQKKVGVILSMGLFDAGITW